MRCSNAPLIISAQSSGSSAPAAAVEPWTSQKSMVTTRRSPAIDAPVRADSSLVSSSFGTYWASLSNAADSAAVCVVDVGAAAGVAVDAVVGAGLDRLFWLRTRSKTWHQRVVRFRILRTNSAERHHIPCRILPGRDFQCYMPGRSSSHHCSG